MSIWRRFTRLIKSIFGGAISAMEDPRLILEQNIRELNDQIPKMNENIASVKANVIMIQKEVKRGEAEVRDLTAKVKAAIQAGREDIAQRYAVNLEKSREMVARTRAQLETASAAYDKALQVKKAFIHEKDRKIAEAKRALRAHERAKWQATIADTLEQFEVAGADQTHDEMLRRVREETAHSEARLELALDSVDHDTLRIEEEAEKIRASEIIDQFKLEMGLASPSVEEKRRETRIGTRAERIEEPFEEMEGASRTIGRQRSRTG